MKHPRSTQIAIGAGVVAMAAAAFFLLSSPSEKKGHAEHSHTEAPKPPLNQEETKEKPSFLAKLFGSPKNENGSGESQALALESHTGRNTAVGSQSVAKPKLKDGCFQTSFQHKKLKSHASGEACTEHKNLFQIQPLAGSKINPASVCVRVNGTPVKHFRIKGKPNLLMIGPVAGPHSVITASYCTGKAQCKKPCKIPKDEFMAALGADSDDLDEDIPQVAWNKGKDGKAKKLRKEEIELDKELKDLKKELIGAQSGKKFFKGWIKKTSQSLSCGNGSRVTQISHANPNSHDE